MLENMRLMQKEYHEKGMENHEVGVASICAVIPLLFFLFSFFFPWTSYVAMSIVNLQML